MTSKKFPIIFLGTDHVSLLAFNQLAEHSAFRIKGVISQPARRKGRGMSRLTSPVAQRANELNLTVLSPDNLKEPQFLDKVKSLKAEWAVLLSYGKILPQDFLDIFPNRALNFHASLLPRWRGAAPIQRAIMAGDERLGMSLQVMEARLDQGPLLAARSFKLQEDMDAGKALQKMSDLIGELLNDLLKYMQGHLQAVPQEESKSSYAHKINKKESLIVWSQPAYQIFNHIRALTMGPQAYTFYRGRRLKIYKSSWWLGQDKNPKTQPVGQVVEVTTEHFKVACGEGLLSIFQVQPESKKIISAEEFIRGYNVKVGDIFKNEE